MKRTVAGILAHVDAGKTTCIESMLYESGKIRKMGRVDHRDTVLDYDGEEREHGITIYAKEASFERNGSEVFVIDTPGHVDFSSEMERCLSVLDFAILLINGQDGVQAHTETIWKCLEHYDVPVIVFVNKMDISNYSEDELLRDLNKHCSAACLRYPGNEEELSMVSEEMLDKYLENGEIDFALLQEAFYNRKFFPVLFGSALKNNGITELLDTMDAFSYEQDYPEEFGARVYRISMSDKGERLTHLKVTGGVLKAKQKITEEEKADQLRFYTGKDFEMRKEAYAGEVVAVTGLTSLEAGQGIGFEEDTEPPLLSGYMNYKLLLPENTDVLALSDVCRQLQSEDPTLEIETDPEKHEIHVRIMGEMQMEVLQRKILEKSGISVGFGNSGIVFRETIRDTVLGVGHFEPLRHYAEVVVRLEPLPRGKGMEVVSEVENGTLSAMFERSILSSLNRTHKGVLTHSPLTDVRIVLVAGKGNLKHTSGGDFRQASRRAVREALMKAENVLLEPYYDYEVRVPAESLSRAMYDLEQKGASFEIADGDPEVSILKGHGPVRTLMNYTKELTAYTKGKGKFLCTPAGYEESKDSEKLIEEIGYDAENDPGDPVGSVFCANGAGYYVPWTDVEKHMHILLKKEGSSSGSERMRKIKVEEADLSKILAGAGSNNINTKKRNAPKKKKKEEEKPKETVEIKVKETLPARMIIDGYNMLYAWHSLDRFKEDGLSVIREKLIDVIFAWQPYFGAPIQLVFDGYKRKDNAGSSYKRGDLEVIYTRTDITADAWIEKAAYEDGGKYDLTVVTSDALIQNAVFSQGARRMSARELEEKILRKMDI